MASTEKFVVLVEPGHGRIGNAVGAGRANPAAVNKDNMIRDGKDALQKALDRVTGGDGTADGEKLNDNMKRETAASVQITNGSK